MNQTPADYKNVHPDAQKGHGGPFFTCIGRMVTGETSVSSSDRFMWLGYEAVLADGSRIQGLREGLQFRSQPFVQRIINFP